MTGSFPELPGFPMGSLDYRLLGWGVRKSTFHPVPTPGPSVHSAPKWRWSSLWTKQHIKFSSSGRSWICETWLENGFAPWFRHFLLERQLQDERHEIWICGLPQKQTPNGPRTSNMKSETAPWSRQHLQATGTGKDFLDRTLAQELRATVDKWNLIKLKGFGSAKETVKQR